MRLDLRNPEHLAKVNTATKYPSIQTYHTLGERGTLLEQRNHAWGEMGPDAAVWATEKLDGTNARVVFAPGEQPLIGSREEFLAALDDIIVNPQMGIVNALMPHVGTWAYLIAKSKRSIGEAVVTLYLEVFGHKATPHWREYTADGTPLFRLLDVKLQDPAIIEQTSLEQLANMRDNDVDQHWLWEGPIYGIAHELGLQRAPILAHVRTGELPCTMEEMASWIDELSPHTAAGVGSQGRSEGIVLRTQGRRIIAKARRENYTKTLQPKGRRA